MPAAPVAPVVPAPAAPKPGGDANQNIFGTKSIEWGGNENDPNAKTVRLRERLNEADTERRKDRDAAEARERAAEIRREERLKKIAYMQEMPDGTPAGTGKWSYHKIKSLRPWTFLSLFFMSPSALCSRRIHVQRGGAGST